MLLKLGVDISRLNREIRRTLYPVDQIFIRHTEEEAVVTSTYEGNHRPDSLHYKNDAYDVRKNLKFLFVIVEDLRLSLGNDFDIVVEPSHIHIEYDPK